MHSMNCLRLQLVYKVAALCMSPCSVTMQSGTVSENSTSKTVPLSVNLVYQQNLGGGRGIQVGCFHWTKFWIYIGVNVMQIKWQMLSTLFTHVFTPYLLSHLLPLQKYLLYIYNTWQICLEFTSHLFYSKSNSHSSFAVFTLYSLRRQSK